MTAYADVKSAHVSQVNARPDWYIDGSAMESHAIRRHPDESWMYWERALYAELLMMVNDDDDGGDGDIYKYSLRCYVIMLYIYLYMYI